VSHELESLGREFFAGLVAIDERVAEGVAAQGCLRCLGPLHRGDYGRKPRGGLVAVAGEAFARRFSLCCGRRGCRKRALPPSVRFLGRRVYLEAVVVLASFVAQVASVAAAKVATAVPARTVRRWLSWWRAGFSSSVTWTVGRARFAPPPPDRARLPSSLLERLGREMRQEATAPSVIERAARWLAPETTRSVPDGSRFVWGA
jgi:hypothetical protein